MSVEYLKMCAGLKDIQNLLGVAFENDTFEIYANTYR